MVDRVQQPLERPASENFLRSLGPGALIVRSGRLKLVREYCWQFFADHQRNPCKLDVGV